MPVTADQWLDFGLNLYKTYTQARSNESHERAAQRDRARANRQARKAGNDLVRETVATSGNGGGGLTILQGTDSTVIALGGAAALVVVLLLVRRRRR